MSDKSIAPKPLLKSVINSKTYTNILNELMKKIREDWQSYENTTPEFTNEEQLAQIVFNQFNTKAQYIIDDTVKVALYEAGKFQHSGNFITLEDVTKLIITPRLGGNEQYGVEAFKITNLDCVSELFKIKKLYEDTAVDNLRVEISILSDDLNKSEYELTPENYESTLTKVLQILNVIKTNFKAKAYYVTIPFKVKGFTEKEAKNLKKYVDLLILRQPAGNIQLRVRRFNTNIAFNSSYFNGSSLTETGVNIENVIKISNNTY